MTSKKILISFIITLTFALGCKSQTADKDYVLTKDEKNLCDTLQIDTTILKDIREFNTNKIEPFHYSISKIINTVSEIDADPIPLKGVVFPEANDKSYELIFSLKDKFTAKGYSIFLLENNFNINNKLDNICVLNTTDKYIILKQIGTDGINLDITNDSLISIIKSFDKKYSLELIGASGDWCEFLIHTDPKSWTQFAKEIYKVCPDVVDQGTGTIEALADAMKNTQRLYFWWD